MTTFWAGLPSSERRGKRCASEGCDCEPVWTMTAGDVSSVYCGVCKMEIVAQANRAAERALGCDPGLKSKRTIDEIISDLEAVAKNFDKGWRAEAPTMAALFRRAARDLMGATTPTHDAYDAACKALRHWRDEAARLGALAGEEPRQMETSTR